jgi:hypothetical protein
LGLVHKFYQEDPYSEQTFGILFALQEASQKVLKQAKETFKDQSYGPMIERFYDDNLSYRCFVSILALCSAVNINVADREIDVTKEYDRMKDFLSKAKSTLEGDKDGYLKHYKLAVKYWILQIIGPAENDAEIRQNMSLKSRKLPFTAGFRSLRVEADCQI